MSFAKWLQLREDGDLNATGTIPGPEDGGKNAFYRPPTPPGDVTNAPDRLFRGGREDMGAGVLFTDGKRVLLLLRSKNVKESGTWGLPAGHAEEGEGSFHTAERECEEEIGLKPFGTRMGKSEEKGGRWVIYLYRVDRPFECRLNDEHDQYKWVPWNELDQINLHPRFREQVPKYKQMLGIKADTTYSQ